jgi:hypothetical protein
LDYDTDFAIGRFDDTGDAMSQRRPGEGRVLDHTDWWYEGPTTVAGWPATETGSHRAVEEPDQPGTNTTDPSSGTTETSWGIRQSREPNWTAPPQPPPPERPRHGAQHRGEDRYPDRHTTRRRGGVERRSPGDVYFSGRRDQYRQRNLGQQELDQGENPDDDDPGTAGYLAAALATVGWLLLPVLAYLGWALLLTHDTRPGCIDAHGAPCAAPRDEALLNLADSVSRIAVAVGLSVTVAMLLRWVTTGWRTISVGFAAAVVGAGVTTVLFSVISS